MAEFIDEEDELQALLGFKQTTCAISGCENENLDERGPISISDQNGKSHQFIMCQPHWEAILLNLGPSSPNTPEVSDEEVDTFMRGYDAIEPFLVDEPTPEPEPVWELTRAEAEHLLDELSFEAELNGL